MLNEYLNNLIYQMAYKSNSSSGVGCIRTAVAKAYKIGSLTKQKIVSTYSRPNAINRERLKNIMVLEIYTKGEYNSDRNI